MKKQFSQCLLMSLGLTIIFLPIFFGMMLNKPFFVFGLVIIMPIGLQIINIAINDDI